MPDDFNIRVTTPGARKAEQDLKKVAAAEREAGGAGKKAGDDAASGTRKALGLTSRLLGSVKGLIAGYVGLQGAMRVLRMLKTEMEEIDRVTENTARSLRSVMALSSVAGARPETKEFIKKAAAFAGRPLGEVSGAYYTLLGGTAGMARPRQEALFKQALLMGKTEPGAPVEPMVGLMGTMGMLQPGMTPQQIGNLMSRTIEAAKSTSAEMAQYLPDILTAAQAAGVDPATAAAMFSFATARGGGVATSGTAVRAAMLGLLAPPPAVAKELGAYGLRPGMDVMQRIGWLGREGGRLPPELIAQLGGRRGLQAISTIASQPGAFQAEISGARGALAMRGSLFRQRLTGMYGEDVSQRLFDQIQSLRVMSESETDRPEVLMGKARQEMVGWLARKQRISPIRRTTWDWYFQAARSFGYQHIPSAVAEQLEPKDWVMMGLMEAGYAPDVLQEHVWPTLQGRQFDPGEEVLRQGAMLRSQGMGPMQGNVQMNVGGTHYHNSDKRDPAGRVVPSPAQ
ncbi:MAG TPA: phage tail tape measure protein [Phycisphaerae bacterium]|nr:phage tail tape measure protein [Phycisphaerae bacterium]